MVADTLSRIPGAENLDLGLLCSVGHTLGLCHVDSGYDDVSADVAAELACNGVLSLFENNSF